MCQTLFALDKVIWLYWIILLIYAVLSWVPNMRGSWSRFIDALVEPVLTPVRRLLPPAGGIDWSFLVVIAVLWIIDGIVRRNLANCYF